MYSQLPPLGTFQDSEDVLLVEVLDIPITADMMEN